MSGKYEDDPEQRVWISALKENPKVQEFFGRHRKTSIEDFCEGYAFFKNLSIRHGDMYRSQLEEQESEGIELATEHLKVIQQKKLFDMQCLWRAGQIDIPEISNSLQFLAWEARVLDCPFLEPVSETDVAWYMEFLAQQTEVPDYDSSVSWQNYPEFKDNYYDDDKGEELPEWYAFHNMKTGNGVYLSYPDTRGDLESHYLKIRSEHIHRDRPPHEPYTDPEAGKPFLSRWDNAAFLQVAEFVEDKKTLRLMTAYHQGTENKFTWEQERADEDFRYLSSIKGELVPIEAHRDFREALHLAVESYRIKKLVEHLPAAHRKYLLMLENGFSFFKEENFDTFGTYQKLAADIDGYIAEGKRLGGEDM